MARSMSGRSPGMAVKVWDIGFDIQEWCVVQNIHRGGVDNIFVDSENFNNVETDLVYTPG